MAPLNMKSVGMLIAAILCGGMANQAASQEATSSYPSKPITIIFNSSGTTSSDTELRLYQNPLKAAANVPIIFDYKGGGGGAVGAIYVSRQRPDGYNYLATPSSIVSVPLVIKDIEYDVLKDFEPVTMMSKKSFMVLVHPSAPYRTINEYLAYARANPGKLNWGTSGDGSSTHLPGLLLHIPTRTEITYISYKDPNGKLIDLMANRVQVTVGTVQASMGYIKGSKMRAIAVTDTERSKLLPDLPTVAESKIPELADYQSVTWLGIFAPAKTPAGILNKFTGFVKQVSKDPFITKTLEETDSTQVVDTPEHFKQFVGQEYGRLSKVLKAAGITPQ